MTHIYARELNGPNALILRAGNNRQLFPIGYPPTGILQRVAVRQSQADVAAGLAVPFTVRVYDADIRYVASPTLWTPDANDPPAGGTFTIPANPTTTYAQLPNQHFTAEVNWKIRGVDYVQRGVSFDAVAPGATTAVITAVGVGNDLPMVGARWTARHWRISYLQDAAVNPNIEMAIIVDPTYEGASGLAADAGGLALFAASYGISYCNREGSFAVPVRRLYLEIDLGDYVSSLSSAPHEDSGDLSFEADLTCQMAGEVN